MYVPKMYLGWMQSSECKLQGESTKQICMPNKQMRRQVRVKMNMNTFEAIVYGRIIIIIIVIRPIYKMCGDDQIQT